MRITIICARLLVVGVLIGTTAASGCVPMPEPPPRAALLARRDSIRDSVAHVRGPGWRAEHYPAADLHGPFPRPILFDTSADPNDPLVYYRLGDSLRYHQPGAADRALYWATRLDPTFADAYFARWALLRRDYPLREMPDGTIRDVSRLAPNVVLSADSLLTIAIAYSPFLEGTLDVPRWIMRLDDKRASEDPTTAGMRAYGKRDYRKATAEWAKALHKEPRRAMLHIARAYAWVRLNQTDSAIADLSELIRHLETLERDSVVAPYFAKDFLYYAVGMLQGSQQRFGEARIAFEHTLLENLGFYMAHVRLAGTLAMLADTTTALSELETAILIRPDDPLVLVYDGSLLVGAGRVAEGEQRLRAALRADSDYALPHVFLGLAAEKRNDTKMARAEYTDYLIRAPRSAGERVWATQRLRALGAR